MSLQDFYNSKIRTPEEFVRRSLGNLYCYYSLYAKEGGGNSATLSRLYEYLSDDRKSYLYLVVGKEFYRADYTDFWEIVLQNLEDIYRQQKSKAGVVVTAHVTTALGWSDREMCERAYFDVGGQSVFCDVGRGFVDLCAALNLPIVNDDEED